MGKSTFEGLAVAVADYEENYLQSVDTQPTKIMSIAQLVHEAGGKCVRAVLPSAFEDADELEGDSTFYQDEVNAWKQANNRQNLPVMRVKVTVEVELLTDSEAGEVWEQHKATRKAFLAQRTG